MSRRARHRRGVRDPDQPDRYPAPLVETPAPSRPAAPAVVAVVVTRDPGPWLERAVDALAAQDYSNLAVLFIDAASDTDPTPRVARALPDAYVRRLDENPGFGAAANHVRDRSEEHTSELPSLMRISYAVFCLTKKKNYLIVYTHACN